MTNPINYQNQTIPAYSGITINITNPTLNPPSMNHVCQPNCQVHNHSQNTVVNERFNNAGQYGITPVHSQNPNNIITDVQPQNVQNIADPTLQEDVLQKNAVNPQENLAQAYPPQYYLNNYNYIQNGEKGNAKQGFVDNKNPNIDQLEQPVEQAVNTVAEKTQEEDLNSSKEIINELNTKIAEQKELEKNGKQTRVVALTNEYIMSLENYLNNPNTEIRLMASKEILTRLDEDKNRYDDAALNALLNKMLQDPAKLVRMAALSAFASQLASGNEYTVELLTNIQNNPNSDKEDVIQAANSLLKMSSRTEVRYTPVKQKESKSTSNKDAEATQKQIEQLKGQLQKYKEKEIEKMLQVPQGK